MEGPGLRAVVVVRSVVIAVITVVSVAVAVVVVVNKEVSVNAVVVVDSLTTVFSTSLCTMVVVTVSVTALAIPISRAVLPGCPFLSQYTYMAAAVSTTNSWMEQSAEATGPCDWSAASKKEQLA